MWLSPALSCSQKIISTRKSFLRQQFTLITVLLCTFFLLISFAVLLECYSTQSSRAHLGHWEGSEIDFAGYCNGGRSWPHVQHCAECNFCTQCWICPCYRILLLCRNQWRLEMTVLCYHKSKTVWFYNRDGNRALLLLIQSDHVLQHPWLHGATCTSHSPEITIYLWMHVFVAAYPWDVLRKWLQQLMQL